MSTDAIPAEVDDAIDSLLAEHDPAVMSVDEFRGYQYDYGLAWVHFPAGFGGLGLAPRYQRHIEGRLRDAGAGPADAGAFFFTLAGPTVVTHGSDEQKRRFLRPMFTGEERWCQLFSEPGAGSDFAGLATRAVRDGEVWTVDGQKVWNTLAHLADRGMLVARSDPDAPKHKGMTYFALDMHAEGVEVRPLRQITGEAEFNEVYMTGVRVSDADRIGDEGEGWRVALTTLMNERTVIGGGGSPKRGSGSIAELVRVWAKLPAEQRTATRQDRMMQLWSQAETLRLTNMRASQNRRAGNPGPEGSVAKAIHAELNKDIFEECVNLQGLAGSVDFDYAFRRPDVVSETGVENGIGHAFLRSRANSIEGGTTEIMRNILGEQILGLPGEPRVDKAIPWNEVPRN
ncbi:acyl-CoA dehydrogenase family protein [Candidatus Poriferisocius sp.]|uniref:acyl-CoA dehydrogenase family protein n=1 Tax=Candidatus Poriferisocius sp. TaxID=3101276 RepID=UPI003B02BEB4